jgi:hypothetical protein
VGIDVRVESENGEVVSELLDPWGQTQGLLPRASDPDSRCLCFVDRSGDAVFNQLQIPVLITELRRQLEVVTHPAVLEHGNGILKLVESAAQRVHIYVRFIGD